MCADRSLVFRLHVRLAELDACDSRVSGALGEALVASGAVDVTVGPEGDGLLVEFVNDAMTEHQWAVVAAAGEVASIEHWPCGAVHAAVAA